MDRNKTAKQAVHLRGLALEPGQPRVLLLYGCRQGSPQPTPRCSRVGRVQVRAGQGYGRHLHSGGLATQAVHGRLLRDNNWRWPLSHSGIRRVVLGTLHRVYSNS
jgi:hypothetical protein